MQEQLKQDLGEEANDDEDDEDEEEEELKKESEKEKGLEVTEEEMKDGEKIQQPLQHAGEKEPNNEMR